MTFSIPAELGNLDQLTLLNASSNQLTGSIPAELGNLSKLTYFQLHNNQLSGHIPAELGKLQMLKNLVLANNQLSGVIPAEFGQLEQLTFLKLNDNQLTGAIPPELGQLQLLTRLDLRNNMLTSTIPSELSSAAELATLNLSYNMLSGMIPTEISSLTQLSTLDLSNNYFTGNIPAELLQLTNLWMPNRWEPSLNNNCLSPLASETVTDIFQVIYANQDACGFNGEKIPSVNIAENYAINIPSIYVNGQSYRVTLERYQHPTDINGWYWRVATVEELSGNAKQARIMLALPVMIDESMNVTFHQIQLGAETISANIDYYQNPYDADGMYYHYK